MELIVKSRNGKVTDRQRSHIEEKLNKLERYLDGISKVTVEIGSEMRRDEGEMFRAQVTLLAEHGLILRAEERAADLNRAIDEVQGKLQRQLTRYKDKHWRRGKVRPSQPQPELVEPIDTSVAETDGAERMPRLVRTKEFALKPMFAEDALEQMELLGHSIYVFRDAETSRISVLYRRSDGDYGLIVPDEG